MRLIILTLAIVISLIISPQLSTGMGTAEPTQTLEELRRSIFQPDPSQPAAEKVMVLQARTGSTLVLTAELARTAEGRPRSKTVAIAEPTNVAEVIKLSLDAKALVGSRYEKLELVLESLGPMGGGLLLGEGATYLIRPGTKELRLGNYIISTLKAKEWCLMRMGDAASEPELEGEGITVRKVNSP